MEDQERQKEDQEGHMITPRRQVEFQCCLPYED